MNTKVISAILMALSLGAFSVIAVTAQTKKVQSHSVTQEKKEMLHDHMMMVKQTAKASSVNVEFARAAVAEMRHSFDQMKEHHSEHMQTMNAEMHTKMSGMMRQMVTHQTEMNTQLPTE